MKKRNKTIYFITSTLPAIEFGAQVRNFYLLKKLINLRYKIVLFCIVEDKKQMIQARSLSQKLRIKVFSVTKRKLNLFNRLLIALFFRTIPYLEEYRLSHINKLIINEAKNLIPDLIIIEHFNAFYASNTAICSLKEKGVPILFDEHNIEQDSMAKTINTFPLAKKIIGKYLLPKYIKLENSYIKLADRIITCSNIDKSNLMNLYNNKNITIIPNGVDCKLYSPSKSNNTYPTIAFTGSLDYWPNYIGLRWYFDKIHPLVINQIPKIRIYIVGKKPPVWLKKLSKILPEVIVTNYVKNVRLFLKQADVCICPLTIGSGTRLKILEYLAMGKPTVSTAIGAQGINVTNGKNIILANNANNFAQQVIRLLKNKKNADFISKQARKFIVNNYTWEITTKNMQPLISNICNH